MKTKRIFPALLLALLLMVPAGLVHADMAPTNVGVVINGTPLWDYTYLDPNSGHVLVPADSLSTAINAAYKDSGSSVTISGPDKSATVKADAVVRQNSQVLVPLRYVIESLGGKVTWREADRLAFADITPMYQSKTYTVNMPGDYFTPFALMINAGDTVNFTNQDTDVHTVVTTADAPAKVELTLEGGKQASYLFTQPGLYHYYCTVHAAPDAATSMIMSVKGTDVFPAAMEGYIFVAGKGLNPAASATVAMPGDRFTPESVVVKAGGTVTFVNNDSDVHTVVTIPGSPADVELTTKGGEKATFTFTKPGIYVYYCSVHAFYDSQTGMIKAISEADVFPGAMLGVVAVAP